MASLRLFFVCLCGWWCIIALFQMLVTSYEIKISYTDDELQAKGLDLLDQANYPKGDVVLRFARANSTSILCSESNLVLRLVKVDGSVSKIPVDFRFPDFNFCQDITDNGVDGIWMYPIPPNFIIITYFTADDPKSFSNAQVKGLLIDTSGKIYTNDYLFGPAFFPAPGKLNPGGIILSAIPGQGFIFLIDDNQSNGLLWTLYTNPDTNGTFSPVNNQQIIQEPEKLIRPKLWATAFSTLDGGYAVIGGYNVTNATTAYDPRCRVYITFFRPQLNGDIDQVGPYLFYQSYLPDVESLPMICSNSNRGIGYVCLARSSVTTTAGNITSTEINYQLINFLTSGSVTDTRSLPLGKSNVKGNISTNAIAPAKLYSLFYGGYLQTFGILENNTLSFTGSIFDDQGNFFEQWGFGSSLKVPSTTASDIVLENNTYVVFYFVNKTLTATSTNLHRFYNETIVNSRNIKEVLPLNGTSISSSSESLIIIYDSNVTLSNNNITIYQENPDVPDGGHDLPRMFCNAKAIRGCSLKPIGNRKFNLTPLASTFNKPGASYYVQIDTDFVKDTKLGEPIPGVVNRTWGLLYNQPEETFAATTITLLRLTRDGSKYFNELSSSERSEFFDELKRELVLAIPIDPSRISTIKKHQIDTSTPEHQILISYTFEKTREPNQRSTKSLINDLDILVRNKEISSISFYPLTNLLDKEYGSHATPNLWDKYKTRLLILFLALLLVLVLFMMARIRNNEGNNWAIMQIALILLDFALDVAFLINNARDVEWIYLPSLLFLLIPVVSNCILAFLIFLHEHEHNKIFLKWSNRNIKLIPAFTVLAAADVEALNILGSRLAGLNAFSAPFSEKAMAWIFWASTFNMFIEDLPQLIIQVLYQRNTVTYDIIPLLALVTSSVMLTINILGRIYQIIHYLRQGQLRYATPPIKDEGKEDQDSGLSRDNRTDKKNEESQLIFTNIQQQQQFNAHNVTVAQSGASTPTSTSDQGAQYLTVYTDGNDHYPEATGHQPHTPTTH
ncbi:5530_t:CDS:10 [Ambispora gerdemannii]|uniref:5530_t:CDS:1 n=1 Tax=Ambispora gerdemannii TaxID=144530 RepID=A0A9N9CWM5_9GLOM|nr:5530_t:CDS:10 [Ambispora gerdemannii]